MIELKQPKQIRDLSTDELKFLQENLSALGYYKNAIDGIFGPNTQQAWKSFKTDFHQSNHDLIGEGSLEILLKQAQNNKQYSEEEIHTLTLTAAGEVRGESDQGVIAMIWVVLNRVAHSKNVGGFWWGDSVKEVCLKDYQFSCWNKRDPNRDYLFNLKKTDSVYQRINRLVRETLDGKHPDPTGGADHYHTTNIKPDWSNGKTVTATIRGHHFYRLNFAGHQSIIPIKSTDSEVVARARFSMKLQKTSQLLFGKLDLIDKSEKILHSLIATSGINGHQHSGAFSTRGAGCCPPYKGLKILTSGYPLATKGIEGMFYPIVPSPIPGYGRAEIGLHDDANKPGSAGCIVIENKESFLSIVVPAMKKALQAGVKEIPLEIIYF